MKLLSEPDELPTGRPTNIHSNDTIKKSERNIQTFPDLFYCLYAKINTRGLEQITLAVEYVYFGRVLRDYNLYLVYDLYINERAIVLKI